jgi:DNA-binding CsgD family transcriptional regulator
LTEIAKKYGVSRQRVHQMKQEFEKKHGRINRRIFIDSITLKHYLDQGWTAKQIAERFSMKPSKVTRLIRKAKEQYEDGLSAIKVERKKVKDLITREELYDMYIRQLKTDKEIAAKYQISPSTVGSLRKQYKIPTKHSKGLRKLPGQLTKEKFKQHYLIEKKTLKEIAKKYTCHVTAILALKETYEIKR